MTEIGKLVRAENDRVVLHGEMNVLHEWSSNKTSFSIDKSVESIVYGVTTHWGFHLQMGFVSLTRHRYSPTLIDILKFSASTSERI